MIDHIKMPSFDNSPANIFSAIIIEICDMALYSALAFITLIIGLMILSIAGFNPTAILDYLTTF